MIDEANKKIDKLLHIRNQGMIDYSKATSELIKLGVKIGKNINGNLTVPNSFSKYLDKYNHSNMEFEWQAIFNNGIILNQYEEDGTQLNYKHIDQKKLKEISYISNFSWPTDNEEKRVIVKLNFETGIFEIINGFVDQKTKGELYLNPIEGEKKLILFTRKRFSNTTGELNNEYREFSLPVEEFFYYNRFILGYETENGKKMCIIEPNGIIKIFEN